MATIVAASAGTGMVASSTCANAPITSGRRKAGFTATPINDVEALERLFETQGDRICAVMIECIQGESGVGKEVIARFIHDASGRTLDAANISFNLLKTAAGVIPHEYGIREDGVRWTAYRPYIAPDGLCISYGNPAEDATNKTVLAAHRENVEVLLPRAGEIWDLP